MNNEKIAILVDSCLSIPQELIDKYNIYVVPYEVIFKDGIYKDGVDITPQEVYRRLPTEIPTTSVPSIGEINNFLDQIKADGYEKVLAIGISSGLSGVYNNMRLAGLDYEGLEVVAVDTKNIAIGSGIIGIQAADYVKNGMDWDTLLESVAKDVLNTRIFFCVNTLEYLQKGGRIGKVAAILGSALNLRPIISCDDTGVFYTADKVIGRKRSIKKAIELVVEFVGNSENYNIAIAHGNSEKEVKEIKDALMKLLPNCNIYFDGEISPTMGVHTGPGTIGIAIQTLP